MLGGGIYPWAEVLGCPFTQTHLSSMSARGFPAAVNPKTSGVRLRDALSAPQPPSIAARSAPSTGRNPEYAIGKTQPKRPPGGYGRATVLSAGSVYSSPVKPNRAPVGFDHPSFAMDRVSISELVRITIGRAEDTALLQTLRPGQSDLSDKSRARVSVECTYREEWRTGREEELLSSLRSSKLFSSSSSPPVPKSDKSSPVFSFLLSSYRSALAECMATAAPATETSPGGGDTSVCEEALCVVAAMDTVCAPALGPLTGQQLLEAIFGRIHSQRILFREAVAIINDPVSAAEASLRSRKLVDIKLRVWSVISRPGVGGGDAAPSSPPSPPSPTSPPAVNSPKHKATVQPPPPPSDSDVSRMLTMGLKAAAQASKRYDASVKLQSMFRGFLARARVNTLIKRLNLQPILRNVMARRIQFAARRWLLSKKWAASHAARKQVYLRRCVTVVSVWSKTVSRVRAQRVELLGRVSASLPSPLPPPATNRLTPKFSKRLGYGVGGRVLLPPSTPLPPPHGPLRDLLLLDASIVLQSFGRLVVWKRRARRRLECVIKLQCFARMCLAKARCARLSRPLRCLPRLSSLRRSHTALHKLRRLCVCARAPLQDYIRCGVFLGEEEESAEEETRREITDFERGWEEHEARLTAAVLKGRLGEGWVLQEGATPGEPPQYLNLKTGKVTSEHPLRRKALTLAKEQREAATEKFRERLTLMREYKEEVAEKRTVRMTADLTLLEAIRTSLRIRPLYPPQ